VYDMYPWNAGSAASTASGPKAAQVPPATTAVQVALDRRDNGGGAAAEPAVALARQ